MVQRHVVVRHIDRARAEAVDGLGAAGAATVHEAIGRRGFLGPDLVPIQSGARVGGSAITVLSHPGDNIMLHAAVEVCQPGDMLIVTTTAPSTHGMFGDLLATSLMARGVRGLVIAAGVRDVAELNEMAFPVWTRHVSCQGTVKNTAGSVNIAISIGGVIIEPGNVIVADDDGVVAVPRAEAEWALERSNVRIANEDVTRERLRSGELGLDFYGLREKLGEIGVEYLDRAPEAQGPE